MPSHGWEDDGKVLDLQRGIYWQTAGKSLFCPLNDNFWFVHDFGLMTFARMFLRRKKAGEEGTLPRPLPSLSDSISNRYRDQRHRHPCQ